MHASVANCANGPDKFHSIDIMTRSAVPRVLASLYRGSQKHKNRPVEGRKGTLCPEWTHQTSNGGYAADPFVHRWEETEAHRMFGEAVDSTDGRRRFATARGIAFEAKLTADGTWHGYPVPWESVPALIVDNWRKTGKVSKRDLRLHGPTQAGDLYWALSSDMS